MINNRFWTKTFDENDTSYLGMHITKRKDGSIVVDSKEYEEQIKEVKISPQRTKEVNSTLTEDEEASFRASLGKLMWVTRLTRPDVAFEAAASAQKYEDCMELLQDYNEYHLADPFIKETYDDQIFVTQEETLETADMSHMPGFEETSVEQSELKVNKINLNKNVQ